MVLAEGNTAPAVTTARCSSRCRGSRLATATPDDFVHVDWTALMAVVDSDTEAGADDVAVALAARAATRSDGRPPTVRRVAPPCRLLRGPGASVPSATPTPFRSSPCSAPDRAEALATAGSLFPIRSWSSAAIRCFVGISTLVSRWRAHVRCGAGTTERRTDRRRRGDLPPQPRPVRPRPDPGERAGDHDDGRQVRPRSARAPSRSATRPLSDDTLAARIDTRLDEPLRRARWQRA